MNQAYLLSIREVQQYTGPNMCLASSKFLTLKLLGFVAPSKHVNDFLSSAWAKRHAQLPLKSYWGGSMTDYNDRFNKLALPAAVNDASAGVKASGTSKVRFHIGFTYFFGSPSLADKLLDERTPLVVGVSIHGGSGRDHFIVVFRDVDNRVWAIDPWPGPENDAVVELGTEFTFTTRTEVHLTADEVKTTIPCGRPFFGYYV